MKITTTLLALLCAMVFAQEKGTLTDSRDKKQYKTVKIGEQTWMAENLNYNAKGSFCYEKKDANCTKYGRLYEWTTAMALPDSCKNKYCASKVSANHQGVCPAGWHISSDADWNVLMKFANPDCSENNAQYKNFCLVRETFNGSYCECKGAGTKLMATSWGGTDDYGFSTLPGGSSREGYFYGGGGEWWSATEHNAYFAYRWIISGAGADGVKKIYSSKEEKVGLSIRCLLDSDKIPTPPAAKAAEQGAGAPGGGYGLALETFTPNKTTAAQKEAFTVQSKLKNTSQTDTFPGGYLGVALTDDSGNIVAVAGTFRHNATRAPGEAYMLKTINCVVPDNVKPGQYKLKTLVKPINSEEWRVATTSVNNTPTAIDFTVK